MRDACANHAGPGHRGHGRYRLALAIALLIAGCGGRLRLRYPFEEPAALSRHYRRSAPALQAISAEARVDQRGERGRIRGSVLMFVRRGGRVRFDVMTQFGPAMVLTSDGERFSLADFQDGRFLSGPTCASNIARLLRMPLTARQVSQVLLGQAPEVEAVEQKLSWLPEDGVYRLFETTSDGHVQELDLKLDPRDADKPPAEQRLRLAAVRLRGPSGGELWRVQYEDHERVRGPDGVVVTLPFHVHVIQGSSNTDTVVKFKDIQLNPEVPSSAFTQPVPAGMAVEEAPCE